MLRFLQAQISGASDALSLKKFIIIHDSSRIRSSNIERTILTARCIMSGMFGKENINGMVVTLVVLICNILQCIILFCNKPLRSCHSAGTKDFALETLC